MRVPSAGCGHLRFKGVQTFKIKVQAIPRPFISLKFLESLGRSQFQNFQNRKTSKTTRFSTQHVSQINRISSLIFFSLFCQFVTNATSLTHIFNRRHPFDECLKKVTSCMSASSITFHFRSFHFLQSTMWLRSQFAQCFYNFFSATDGSNTTHPLLRPLYFAASLMACDLQL